MLSDSINQSINEDLTSGSSPKGDVRNVSNSIYNYRQHPTTRTLLQMHKQKEKCEVKNSARPLSKARRSVTTDLRWEDMSFELALESSNACTRSQILWQRISYLLEQHI